MHTTAGMPLVVLAVPLLRPGLPLLQPLSAAHQHQQLQAHGKNPCSNACSPRWHSRAAAARMVMAAHLQQRRCTSSYSSAAHPLAAPNGSTLALVPAMAHHSISSNSSSCRIACRTS